MVCQPIPIKRGKCKLATASFGHGITTTPLQLAKGYSIITNGGYDVKPTLIKRDLSTKEQRRRFLKEGVSEKINLIPKKVNFSDCVSNVSYASMMVAGFSTGNKYLIGKSMNDTIVEPARSHTIPNYDELKHELLRIGALGVTISGAGPSVISILDSKKSFTDVKKCFQAQFKSAGYDSSIILTKIGKGARVIK